MSRVEMVQCDFEYLDGDACGLSAPTRIAEHWELGERDLCPKHRTARPPVAEPRLPRAYAGLITALPRGEEP